MVIFGMILKSIMTMFLPLMIRSGLGKNFCTSKCDEIDTNYYVIAVLTLYVCFVVIFSRFVHPATLAQEDMTKRMGALYAGLRYYKQQGMNYWPLFYLKRILYVMFLRISVAISLRIGLLIGL